MGHLGYAVTAHRAQGITLDTGHCVVHSTSMTRETFYVAMTRGHESNHAYVATDQPHLEEHQKPLDALTAADVLAVVLAHVGAELSAHETITVEQEAASNIGQLAAEYDTIAQHAQRDRWISALHAAGVARERVREAIEAESFGMLAATLRRAEATGHDVAVVLPAVVRDRALDDADDIAAVIAHRLDRALHGVAPRETTQFVAGLIPVAAGPMSDDMHRALGDRATLIRARAHELVEQAIRDRAEWITELGDPPSSPTARRAWLECAATVTAYRDRYRVTAARAVDESGTGDWTRLADRDRARRAAERARQLAGKSASAHIEDRALAAPVRNSATP